MEAPKGSADLNTAAGFIQSLFPSISTWFVKMCQFREIESDKPSQDVITLVTLDNESSSVVSISNGNKRSGAFLLIMVVCALKLILDLVVGVGAGCLSSELFSDVGTARNGEKL